MARSVEDILRDMLGSQAITMARMQAQLEAVTEELQKLKQVGVKHELAE